MKELSLINSRLDSRYDIREVLGRGSYAEIFRATDILASPQSPHSTVVIKALNVFLQDDLDDDLERTLVENFQNEAIALDRVRHPNIISRIGHGTARDLDGKVFHYLVLEYMAGGDMQSAVRKRSIPPQRSMKYVEQICAGLGHAHSRGVIHRDIKPQNLLLTADRETVKIADFGVARFSMAETPITRVGTNIYAPPEHTPLNAGNTGPLDQAKLTPAADIYSLAKSIYTIITNETPRAFSNQPITSLPLDYRDEEWSEELLRVLRRATDDDPARRPQSVEELWNDLANVRRSIEHSEVNTVVSPREEPLAQVSRGYSPLVPEQPHFEAIEESPANVAANAVERHPALPPADARGLPDPAKGEVYSITGNSQPPGKASSRVVVPKKRSSLLRRFAAFAIFLVIFTGILYGTHAYMRNAGILPDLRNAFKTRTAVANTDIYLRPDPSTDNDPIGLVTKNSKVRIVNSQNNWYQVDVVEQGRSRANTSSQTRGWLNGKYLDIDPN